MGATDPNSPLGILLGGLSQPGQGNQPPGPTQQNNQQMQQQSEQVGHHLPPDMQNQIMSHLHDFIGKLTALGQSPQQQQENPQNQGQQQQGSSPQAQGQHGATAAMYNPNNGGYSQR